MPASFDSTRFGHQWESRGEFSAEMTKLLRKKSLGDSSDVLIEANEAFPAKSFSSGTWSKLTNWCSNRVLMRVMDAVKETIVDVLSVNPWSKRMTTG